MEHILPKGSYMSGHHKQKLLNMSVPHNGFNNLQT